MVVITLAFVAVIALILLTGGTKPGGAATPPPFETGITPEGFPYKGAADAPVTIDIYSDYTCSHCRDFALEIEPLIDQNYVAAGKVKLVSHYFGFTLDTQTMATAALCAAEQGKFWQFDHILFANQLALNTGNMSAFARQAGLEIDTFSQCFQSAANKTRVQSSTNLARSIGVEGTPTFFVNGNKVVGAVPYEEFSQAIERALAGEP